MSSPERRKANRRPILDTFSVFAVIPKKGPHRLTLLDVSDMGIGVIVDTEGETAADFPVKNGDTLEVQFYLNQSLYLPLAIKVMRVETKNGLRQVGGELVNAQSAGHKGYVSFIAMLDSLTDVARIAQS